jgi:hypothetical protein
MARRIYGAEAEELSEAITSTSLSVTRVAAPKSATLLQPAIAG